MTNITVIESKKQEAPESFQALSQAIHVYNDRSHAGNKKTKRRGEVNRTKKKVYKQKGTGGARHGARSAPIFVGGGVTHGPDGLKKILVLSDELKKKALEQALYKKSESKNLVSVDSISSFNKTKQVAQVVKEILTTLGKKKDTKVLFVVGAYTKELFRAFSNISNAEVVLEKDLNALKVYLSGVVAYEKSSEVKEKKQTKKPKKS